MQNNTQPHLFHTNTDNMWHPITAHNDALSYSHVQSTQNTHFSFSFFLFSKPSDLIWRVLSGQCLCQ